MKFKLFSYLVLFFFGISSGKAQMLNFLSGKKKESHYNYSTYSPKKDRHDQRETRKSINNQLAKSYRPPKNNTALSREEAREVKYNKKRIERSRGETNEHLKKRAQKNSYSSNKYATRAERKRAKEVAYNKKHYGTKATRKAAQTHKSERNIIDNDEGKKSFFRFKRNA